MTFRLRNITTRKRRSHWESEERQQFWVTLGFIGLIVLALLILGGAVAAGYYDEHFKPVAKVGDVSITRDAWRDRIKVELIRIETAERRLRESIARGEISQSFAQQQLDDLSNQRQAAPTGALDDLIDQRFQERLAGPLGVTVGEPDIDALLEREATASEQRDVQAIFVEPEIDDEADEPTAAQKQAARTKAEKALAELKAGKAFGDVARGFSTDASRERGGEYGRLTKENSSDDAWVEALFALPLNGTTEVIEGGDGVYRIGRVTKIVPAVKDDGYVKRIEETVSLGAYRDALKGRLLAEKLEAKVVADATAGDIEQVHAYEIFVRVGDIRNDPTAALGEVKAAHILYSPKDDAQTAADLPATDPAWAAAKKEADEAAAKLRAEPDATKRATQFAELAKAASDDTSSGATGGDLGYFTKSRMVQEFADAVFDKDHQVGEIIGPVKTQFGWHVILFQDRKGPPESRIKEILDLVKAPGADFEKIARERSDETNASKGGEIGWVARNQLEKKEEDALFALQPGQTSSEAVTLSDGMHVYRVTERAQRPLDETQRDAIEQNGFNNWFDPQKEAAEADGTIFRDPSTVSGNEPVQ
jgi:parvulin-like peptidyl-prolyl isomerase